MSITLKLRLSLAYDRKLLEHSYWLAKQPIFFLKVIILDGLVPVVYFIVFALDWNGVVFVDYVQA